MTINDVRATNAETSMDFRVAILTLNCLTKILISILFQAAAALRVASSSGRENQNPAGSSRSRLSPYRVIIFQNVCCTNL